MLLAMSTFLPSPTMNLEIPSPIIFSVMVRSSISFWISSYLTIGPATICGNSVTNAMKLAAFF